MASPVQEFLRCLPALAGRPERISELLSQARLSPRDLEAYIFFREQFYTRNLIFQDRNFEVLTLCWQQGQQTPIHDHNGSEGWAYIVKGGLNETIFQVKRQDSECDFDIVEKDEDFHSVGEVAYINDKIGCHRLANVSSESSISLHIYSPLIKSCRYYSLAPRHTMEKNLCYFSVNGTVLPPAITCP